MVLALRSTPTTVPVTTAFVPDRGGGQLAPRRTGRCSVHPVVRNYGSGCGQHQHRRGIISRDNSVAYLDLVKVPHRVACMHDEDIPLRTDQRDFACAGFDRLHLGALRDRMRLTYAAHTGRLSPGWDGSGQSSRYRGQGTRLVRGRFSAARHAVSWLLLPVVILRTGGAISWREQHHPCAAIPSSALRRRVGCYRVGGSRPGRAYAVSTRAENATLAVAVRFAPLTAGSHQAFRPPSHDDHRRFDAR